MDRIPFLLARLDEDALWATEASRDGDNIAQDGAHWHWVANDTDTEITPDPGREMTIGEEAEEAVSLRSREEWPTTSGMGPLPQFALYADEVPSAVGGHIVRHDPARVLADVDAKRRTLVRCQEALLASSPMLVHFAQETLREMALPYAHHPDYPRLDTT